ncbi:MAG: alpha/beta hydrolase [Burkholderiales bacterium]|nr:alpha/beta hydrolase [Burkholderiales bacterium]
MTLEEFRRGHAVRSIDVNGVAWPCVDAGSGPCVVLLPGAQGTAEIFHKQFALAGRLRLVSVTYPAETDGATLADGLAAFLDRLGIARASVAGTSLGGYVAQLFAARHPARVDRLVLTCTFVDPGPVQAPDKLASARDTPAETLKEQVLARVRAAPASELRDIQLDLIGAKQDAALLRARMLAVQLAAPVPPLGLDQARITVIDCDNDPVIPAPVRAAVRERYPQAAAHNLAGGGHYPYILCADEYNRLLAARLA